MNNHVHIFLFLSVFFFFRPAESSAESFNFITMEVAPWAYRDLKNGSYSGIFPDLVREIERRTGYKIAITLTPYARIDRELDSLRQDCTMLVRSDYRDKITQLGELIFNHPMGVIPQRGLRLESYEDLTGVRISVLRALSMTEQFNNDHSLKKEMDTSYEIGLRKMNHGRLDAIAGAIPTIQYLAKANGMTDLLGKPLELSVEPIYLQCSKESKAINHLPYLNETIQRIKADNTLERVLEENE